MPGRGSVLAGRVVSALVVLFLLADGAVGLLAPGLLTAEMAKTGWPPSFSAPLVGAVTMIAALLYAFPPTALLGAILVTGFCGGAIATHLRLGEFGNPPEAILLLLGVAAWGGLYLRDARLRALLPLRTRHGST